MNKISTHICLILLFAVGTALAQPMDTLQVKENYFTLKDTGNYHSPKKASIMSAVLPGLGQVYNRKAWKVPIIYAGAGALLYGINRNNKIYKEFLTAYKFRTDRDSTTEIAKYNIYSESALIVAKDYYRRNRDLCTIVLSLLYVANVVDAYVDAQLFNFDISDDLSLHISPNVNYTSFINTTNYVPSLSVAINFKKATQKNIPQNY